MTETVGGCQSVDLVIYDRKVVVAKECQMGRIWAVVGVRQVRVRVRIHIAIAGDK